MGPIEGYDRIPRLYSRREKERQTLVDTNARLRAGFARAVGELAIEVGDAEAARRVGVSPRCAGYCHDKVRQ
jgi:hypothetical protein